MLAASEVDVINFLEIFGYVNLLFFYLLYLSFGSLKWVELKMGQLGVLSNPNYKITALLDHLAMITVQSDSRGTFDCKPLGLIWAQFPEVCDDFNLRPNLSFRI